MRYGAGQPSRTYDNFDPGRAIRKEDEHVGGGWARAGGRNPSDPPAVLEEAR